MSHNNLSGKDEALLILEYLENEHMSKTFLNFLDENQHLHQLRSRLYANYEHFQDINNEDDLEVKEFQTFFNLSIQLNTEQNNQLTFLSHNLHTKNSNDLFFDDDFLNDLISQTPPMDDQHDLPDTPVPSVPPLITTENDEFNSTMSSIEQLFAQQHDQPIGQDSSRLIPTVPYTKCIVVTQDFLQSMYNPQSSVTNNNNLNYIHRPKRRRRRLKVGKENNYQQRKLMPRTSPDHD
jgi:hypothetical protein